MRNVSSNSPAQHRHPRQSSAAPDPRGCEQKEKARIESRLELVRQRKRSTILSFLLHVGMPRAATRDAVLSLKQRSERCDLCSNCLCCCCQRSEPTLVQRLHPNLLLLLLLPPLELEAGLKGLRRVRSHRTLSPARQTLGLVGQVGPVILGCLEWSKASLWSVNAGADEVKTSLAIGHSMSGPRSRLCLLDERISLEDGTPLPHSVHFPAAKRLSGQSREPAQQPLVWVSQKQGRGSAQRLVWATSLLLCCSFLAQGAEELLRFDKQVGTAAAADWNPR